VVINADLNKALGKLRQIVSDELGIVDTVSP